MRTTAETPADQRALLRRARNGDQQAFGALIRGFDHRLRALAYRLLGDADEMDDVLQEAYLKAFAALGRFRADSSLHTWLYRIVYNVCLDRLKRRRAPSFELRPEDGPVGGDPADEVTARIALEEALDALAPVDRAAVLLVDAEGLTYEEAASVVGVPVGTVASRLSRARASLRRSLLNDREGALP